MKNLKLFYDQDANPGLIKGKKVAVIGFGSQGHAHALNLHASGVDVTVGLSPESKSRAKAEAYGLKVADIATATKNADCVMMLLPDEVAAAVYSDHIGPNLKQGASFAVAHGFNIHFNKIKLPEHCAAFMVAPKGPGHLVRRKYQEGSGVPCLIATLNPEDQKTAELALSYAWAIGGTRSGVFQTTFKEETETDLFGEQTVLCGGISELIKAGYETLVEAGYDPVMAYFECLHETKLIVDLLYEGGLSDMNYSISNTAEFGGYHTGPKIIDASVKDRMKQALNEIQSGQFSNQWLAEFNQGSPNFLRMRKENSDHPIEKIGSQIRSRMNFSNDNRLVNKDKN